MDWALVSILYLLETVKKMADDVYAYAYAFSSAFSLDISICICSPKVVAFPFESHIMSS